MLKSKFILLSRIDGEVTEQEIDLELTCAEKSSLNEFELVSYSNKIDFIKNYVNCLNDNKCPVVINSGMPEDIKLSIFQQIISNNKNMDSLGHILCSSGTTSESGTPKSYYFDITKSLGNAKAHYDSINVNKKLNILFPLPLSHSFGVVVGVLGSFVTSSQTYVYEQVPSPVTLVKDIFKYNIDLLYLTPTMVRMILKHKKFIKLEGEGPKIISIGSSPLFKDEVVSLMEIFKNSDIYFTYGLTEAGPRVTTLSCGRFGQVNQTLLKSNTLPLGKALSGVTLKYDSNLFIKSDYAIKNDYFDSEDKMEIVSEEVYLKGRADYVIISGGVNIYPDEVEAIVDNINGVKRSCLIGMESKLYGEVPILCFVTDGNLENLSRDTERIINELLVKNLPSTHVPHDIIELNNIPTTSLGKVMRAKVVSMIKDQNDRKTN